NILQCGDCDAVLTEHAGSRGYNALTGFKRFFPRFTCHRNTPPNNSDLWQNAVPVRSGVVPRLLRSFTTIPSLYIQMCMYIWLSDFVEAVDHVFVVLGL